MCVYYYGYIKNNLELYEKITSPISPVCPAEMCDQYKQKGKLSKKFFIETSMLIRKGEYYVQ